MIAIIAPDAEKTVNDVIDWLSYWQKKYARINQIKDATIQIEINDFVINEGNFKFNKKDIASFWNRKGDFAIHISNQFVEKEHEKKVMGYLSNEWQILRNFLVQQLEQKKHLGNFFLQIPNKLNHLYLAQQAGLAIPKTIISNEKIAIKDFENKSSNIINKSLRDSFTGTFNQIYYYNHTERVNNEMIDGLNDTFFPSLFQEEIQKAYELRIVFVHETLWTMAIFSQNDIKTEVDWRNYNYEKPNRKIPYKLPNEIAGNIKTFIRASGLNTGAIDMVVTKDREYVFLECNPNGQISMVSENCNYFIERSIANYLSTP